MTDAFAAKDVPVDDAQAFIEATQEDTDESVQPILTNQVETATLNEALFAIWQEVHGLERTAENPYFSSAYIPLEDIVNHVKPICIKYGVMIQQGCDDHADGNMWVFTRLTHVATGLFADFAMPLPWDKKTPQAAGSMLAYGKRYTLSAAFTIVADQDDDGNSTKGDSKPLSQKVKDIMNNPLPDPEGAPPPQYEYEPEQKSFNQDNTWTGLLKAMPMTSGSKNGKSWTRCDITTMGGDRFGIFQGPENEALLNRATQALQNQIEVKLQWSMNGKFKVLDRLDLM